METTTGQRRILFVTRAGGCDAAALSRFAGEGDVRTANSAAEAVQLLDGERFDLLVTDHPEWFAPGYTTVSQQAATILDTIGQGVCIVDLEGRVIWSNPKMRAYPDDLINKVATTCCRMFGHSNDYDKSVPAHHRARRISLASDNDQHFEVTMTPVIDGHDEVRQIAAVVWDVTHGRRLQKKIDAIDLAGRELLRLDGETMAGLDIEARIALIEEKIYKYMHELLHFDDFAVLLVDKKTNRLEIALQHGFSQRSRQLDLFASPENNGISGYVAATGRSYICPDTSKDPRYLTGLEAARSSLTVPLRLYDKIIGVFDVESQQPSAFNEDDRQFAEILARYIAMALNMLDLLVTERYQSTGQIANDVTAEIAGPLNDIISEATMLQEEYIGNDDLRRRLGTICDRIGEIKQAIKDVTAPRGGLLGRHPETVAKDPLLSGKRVLVADDEETIRETVAGVLGKHGCEVETACDGAQAVAMLGTRKYDIVLADIKMPNKNGYEVFAAASDGSTAIPVILMTGFGYDPNHSIVRARREGLAAVLFKPFKVDQLLTELRQALAPKD